MELWICDISAYASNLLAEYKKMTGVDLRLDWIGSHDINDVIDKNDKMWFLVLNKNRKVPVTSLLDFNELDNLLNLLAPSCSDFFKEQCRLMYELVKDGENYKLIIPYKKVDMPAIKDFFSTLLFPVSGYVDVENVVITGLTENQTRRINDMLDRLRLDCGVVQDEGE